MSCVLRGRKGGIRRQNSGHRAALWGLAVISAAVIAEPARAVYKPATGIPDPSIASSLPPDLADPGGVRAAFASRGVTFAVNYIGEVFGTASGGFHQGTYYDGRLEVAVTAGMEKVIGWKGLTFFANGYQIHGDSITGHDLGALMPVSYIEATPATRLFEMWFEQKLLDDKLSIRIGQIAADSEFILSEGGGLYINGTWGWPSITAADLPQGGPAYPLATPGVRVAFAPTDNLTLMTGVYNGRPAGECPDDADPQRCNDHGFDFPTGDPPLWMFEGTYKYEVGNLPGTVKLGGWHQEGDSPLLLDPSIIKDSTRGLYAILDQMIYRLPGKDPKGISFFGRVIGAPEDRSFVDMYWEAGLTFSGMVPRRADDVFAIGYAHTGISGDERALERANNAPVISDYEALLELSYTAHIVPGFSIQPDFQYFWNPGGHVEDPNEPGKAVKDAAVVGIRTLINY